MGEGPVFGLGLVQDAGEGFGGVGELQLVQVALELLIDGRGSGCGGHVRVFLFFAACS